MAQEKICGIYCIENLINGKKYIGSSKNIYRRWKQHIFNLNGNIHINDHLQSSWNKYGKDNFTFYIIEKCLQDELCDREKYYISKFNTTNNKHGYNMTSGGDGICNLREECVDKISIGETLYSVVQLSLEGEFIKVHRNCAKASIDVCGNYSMTENIRDCCNNKCGRKSAKGYMWLYEKDYDRNKKYKHQKDKSFKKVSQYDESGKLIKIYDSGCDAEKETGISRKLISSVCHGCKRVAGGYIWRLTGDPFDKYETKNKIKRPVAQYDIDDNFIRAFESCKEVEDIMGIFIGSVLSGRTKTAGGFKWKYID